MLLTYCLTVRLLARQQQNLGGGGMPGNNSWASGWLGQTPALGNFNILFLVFFFSGKFIV